MGSLTRTAAACAKAAERDIRLAATPPLSTLDALAEACELLEELLPANHALLIRIQDAWGRANAEEARKHAETVRVPSFARQHGEGAH